jgi:hypothetical protein
MLLSQYHDYRDSSNNGYTPFGSGSGVNVLDLELSLWHPLSEEFQVPDIVVELSLGHRCAPELPAGLCPVVGVTKFLVLSDPGCQTNFHVDLTATAVSYVILTGTKEVALVSPTEENLRLYRKWDECDFLTRLVLSINLLVSVHEIWRE